MRLLAAMSAAVLLAGSVSSPAHAAGSDPTSRPLPTGVLSKSNALAHTVTVVPVYSTSAPSAALIRSMLDGAQRFWETHVPGMHWKTRITRPVRIASPCSRAGQGAALRLAQKVSGVDYRAKGQHLAVVTPECGGPAASGRALRATGYGWIRVYGQDSDGAVLAHEFGHNLGLVHSNTLECTNRGRPVSLSADCSSVEYGNRDDLMGASSAPIESLRIGPMWQSFLTGRTTVLGPRDDATVTLSATGAHGTQAVRIKTEYGYVYLGALPAGTQAQMQAVLMTKAGAGRLLLPEATSPDAGALRVDSLRLGSHWDIPGTRVRVTVTHADANSLTLQVANPGQQGGVAAPIVRARAVSDREWVLTWTPVPGAKAYLVAGSHGVVARLNEDTATANVDSTQLEGDSTVRVTAVDAQGHASTSEPVSVAGPTE